MTRNGRTLYRAALAACAALVILVAPITSTTTVGAAGGSTWYWQPPTRDCAIQAVACPSISTWVAVAASGLVVDQPGNGRVTPESVASSL
jgi:hypothetical protein